MATGRLRRSGANSGPSSPRPSRSWRPAPGRGQFSPVMAGHLVFVDTVVPGRVPAFEEVESDVKTAWLGKQKAEAWRKAYEEMRAKYTVLLPVPAGDPAISVSEAAPPSDTPTQNGRALR